MHNRHILQCIMQCVTQGMQHTVICNRAYCASDCTKSYVIRNVISTALCGYFSVHKLILTIFLGLAAIFAAAAT